MKIPSRPIDWLAYAGARVGWPGLLGLGLLLGALGLAYFQVQPLQRSAAAMEARASRLARQATPPADLAPPSTLAETLSAVAAPEGVARLFSAAAHAGLRLEQGSYHQIGGSGVKRYQISLPLSGDYPALRAFLAEALQRQPGLALNSLILSRESIASPEVRAKLSLTLYLREAP